MSAVPPSILGAEENAANAAFRQYINNPSVIELIQSYPKLHDAYIEVFESVIAGTQPRFTDNILRQLNGCAVIVGAISDITFLTDSEGNILSSSNDEGTFLNSVFRNNNSQLSAETLQRKLGYILNQINVLTRDETFTIKYIINLINTTPAYITNGVTNLKSLINKKFLFADLNRRVLIVNFLLLYVNHQINDALVQLREIIRTQSHLNNENSGSEYSGNEEEIAGPTGPKRPVRPAPVIPEQQAQPPPIIAPSVENTTELLDEAAVRPTDKDLAELIHREKYNLYFIGGEPHVIALKRAVILNRILTAIYSQNPPGVTRTTLNGTTANNISNALRSGSLDEQVLFARNTINGLLKFDIGDNGVLTRILDGTDFSNTTIQNLIANFMTAYDTESARNNITIDILQSLHFLKAYMKDKARDIMDKDNSQYPGIDETMAEENLEEYADSLKRPPPGAGTGLGPLPAISAPGPVKPVINRENEEALAGLLGPNVAAPQRHPVSLADSGVSLPPISGAVPRSTAVGPEDILNNMPELENASEENSNNENNEGNENIEVIPTEFTGSRRTRPVAPPSPPPQPPIAVPPSPIVELQPSVPQEPTEYGINLSDAVAPTGQIRPRKLLARQNFAPPGRLEGIPEVNREENEPVYSSIRAPPQDTKLAPAPPPPVVFPNTNTRPFEPSGEVRQTEQLGVPANENPGFETVSVEEPLITSLVATLAHMANSGRNVPSEPPMPEIPAPEEPVAPVGEVLNIDNLIAVLAHMAQTPARPSLTTTATNALIEPAPVPAPSTLQSILVEPSAQCDTLPSSTIAVPTFPPATAAAAAAPEVVPSTNISPLVAVLSSMAPPSVPGAPAPSVPAPTPAAPLPAPSDPSSLVAALAGMSRPTDVAPVVPGAPAPSVPAPTPAAPLPTPSDPSSLVAALAGMSRPTDVAPVVPGAPSETPIIPPTPSGPSFARKLGSLFKRTGQNRPLDSEPTITPPETTTPTSGIGSLVAALASQRQQPGEPVQTPRSSRVMPIRGVARAVGPVGRRPAAPRQQLVQGLPSLFPSRRQIMGPAAVAAPTPEAAAAGPEPGPPLVGTPAMGDAFMRTEEAAIANMVAEFAALRKSGSNELERQIAAVKAELKDADALPKDQRETDVVRTRREELKALIKQFDEQLKKLQREMAEISAKGMIAVLEKKRNDLQAELDLLSGGEYLDIFGDLYHTRIIHPTNTEYAIPSLGSVNQLFINYRMGLYRPEKIKTILEILSKYFSRNSPQFMMLPTECPPEDLRVIIPLLRQRLETLDTQIRKAAFAPTPMSGAVITPLAHYYREIYDKIQDFLRNLESVCTNSIPRIVTRREAVELFVGEVLARSLFAVTEAFLQTIFEKMAEGTVRGELAATKTQLEVAQRELAEAKAQATALSAKSDEYVSTVKELKAAADKSAEEKAELAKKIKTLSSEQKELLNGLSVLVRRVETARPSNNNAASVSSTRAEPANDRESVVSDMQSIERSQEEVMDELREIIADLEAMLATEDERAEMQETAIEALEQERDDLRVALGNARQQLADLEVDTVLVRRITPLALLVEQTAKPPTGLPQSPVTPLADSGLRSLSQTVQNPQLPTIGNIVGAQNRVLGITPPSPPASPLASLIPTSPSATGQN